VSGCPCLLLENYRLDGIAFDSLEEIGIKSFTGSDEQEEFLKLLLSRCNTVTLKRVDIRYHLPLFLRRSWRLLKGSAACAILTARSNLMCMPSHWPPNIEDAHAIAREDHKFAAILCLFGSEYSKLWKGVYN
jgi:hypothetical protein